MTKILMTAEAFGFGPVSKLHAIGVELFNRGVECHFVGEAAPLTFARANPEVFASITPVGSMSKLATVAPQEIDAVVSVMDPYGAVWARMNGKPCIYVDSLYWFWQWFPERETDLRKLANHLCSAGTVAEAFEALSEIPMHESQYIAHHLSSVSCAQRTPTTASRRSTMPGIGDVRIVDAVIDLSHRSPETPSGWLATTSGMINPLLPIGMAVEWVRAVAALIEEAAELSGVDGNIDVAGNPHVLALASDVASDRIRLTPLDHKGLLRRMNSAIACLAPPGLTTLLEASAYQTPVVFLPEQHYGHLSNFREISQHGGLDAYPHALMKPDANGFTENAHLEETLSLAEQLRYRFHERDDVWRRMVQELAAGMRDVAMDRTRFSWMQAKLVTSFVGGYKGASQVADTAESVLEGGQILQDAS